MSEAVMRVRRSDLSTEGTTGAPIPPAAVTDRYQLCWADGDDLVFATSADDLLAVWWPAYRTADRLCRQRMRLEDAIGRRTQLIADLVSSADRTGTDLSKREREQMLTPFGTQQDLAGIIWTSTVPLVLIEGTFAPEAGRTAPLSGLDGDVRDPSNIWWLRPRTALGYIRSLVRAGLVDVSSPQ